jgi:hypothetical protein
VFFVEARYHRDASRVGAQVRYIAHREEGLTDGRRREVYGIGDRYRAMRGDEQAIGKALREDARGLRNPVYFRFILTVDNAAAERFRRLDGSFCDRVLRDAVEKTFRGAARGAQGVFAIHQHGGVDRPAPARSRSSRPALRERDGRPSLPATDSARQETLGAGGPGRPRASGTPAGSRARGLIAAAVSSPPRARRRTTPLATAREDGPSS